MKKIITKRQLLNERAVEYDPQHPERMHGSIETKLADRSHDLGAHPAFPPTVGNQNFEEKLASERFKDAISKAKRYTNTERLDLMSNNKNLMMALSKIAQIESQHRDELEKLAINLVKQEMGIKNEVDFIAELNRNPITTAGVKKEPKKEEPQFDFEDTQQIGDIEDEVKKRRLVNSLTQGAAKKGHYMFHLIEDKLNRIDPNLVNYYGIMMSTNDLNYWLIGDEQINAMSEDENSQQAGKVNIGTAGDENDPRPKNEIPKESLDQQKWYVYGRGITFPALVHELIKGAMEIMATSSLPEYEDMEKTEKVQQYIKDRSDFLKAETWDIRLGPGLWEKFLDSIGEDAWEVKNYLYQEIIKMPATQFNSFMKELLSGSQKGKKELAKLAGEIKRDIISDKYEEIEHERKTAEKQMSDTEKRREEEERKRKEEEEAKRAEDDFMKEIDRILNPNKR